jgi:hypothetical protein
MTTSTASNKARRRATPPRAPREERGEENRKRAGESEHKRDYSVGDVLSHCVGVSREQQPHETQPTHPLKVGEIADGFAGVRDEYERERARRARGQVEPRREQSEHDREQYEKANPNVGRRHELCIQRGRHHGDEPQQEVMITRPRECKRTRPELIRLHEEDKPVLRPELGVQECLRPAGEEHQQERSRRKRHLSRHRLPPRGRGDEGTSRVLSGEEYGLVSRICIFWPSPPQPDCEIDRRLRLNKRILDRADRPQPGEGRHSSTPARLGPFVFGHLSTRNTQIS